MTQAYSSVSFTFNVNDIALRAVPVSTPISNEFDYFGTLLGLPRFPEERNDSYKGRLLDVYVHRANSSYLGLINGITRELKLELFKPITINLRTNIDASWSPRIEFKDNLVYIWKDFSTKLVDIIIDRSDPTLLTYRLDGLVDAINTSAVFTAVLDTTYSIQRSDTIVNQLTSVLVESQALAPSKFNYLGNKHIDRGSIIIDDINTFRSEVISLVDVNSSGKYYVDYQTGLITSFDIPSDNINIRYSFIQTSCQPIASPVIIRAINSLEFQRTLFNQVLLSDGSYANGTPTQKGSEIINELMSVTAQYWGS